MIHRKWLLPGTCVALFTLFLILNFYQSEYRIVVQKQGAVNSPESCIPPPASDIDPAQNQVQGELKSDVPLQDPYKSPSSAPLHFDEPIEINPLPAAPIELKPVLAEDDAVTSFRAGDILNADVREVQTNDGSYALRLEDNGNVILYRFIGTQRERNETQQLWSLGTGVVEQEAEYAVRLSKEGVLSVLALFKRADGHVDEQLLWHSDMLPGCLALPKTPTELLAQPPAALEIASNGEVSIKGRCIMYSPPPESTGRLAVLLSGVYRSNRQVCASQIQYLAASAAMSVDFFAYILYEKKDVQGDITVAAIERGIRECYGTYLRTLTLKPIEEVAETWPGEAVPRAPRINNIYAQLKTLYNGGQDWMDWSAANAVQHHTVFRIRTDHEFFADPFPLLKPANQLKGNELVLQPIAGGYPVPLMSHWYCSNPYGGVEVAISDQLAYGRPTAMYFYLNMFKDYARIIDMAVQEHNKAARESWLCLAMPGGTEQKQCGGVEYGTVECALSWYLRLWDLELTVDWNWPLRIVRVEGY